MKNPPSIANLTRLYGSGPRQRLETARFKLRRVLVDTDADPKDVVAEAARLRTEITRLEAQLRSDYLPPKA